MNPNLSDRIGVQSHKTNILMNNIVQVFDFNSQHIRFVDGLPVANDVAEILGYKDPVNTIRKKVSTQNKLQVKTKTSGGYQPITVLTDKGVLQLVSSSRLPNAINIAKRMGLQCFHSTKEQDVVQILESAFCDTNPIRQYQVGDYRIDLYLEEIRVAIECDEHGHIQYDSNKEILREMEIQKKLRCTFIRFNPDSDNFNIGNVISQVREIELVDRQFSQYINELCECMPVLKCSSDPLVAQWADEVFWEAREAYLNRDLPKYQECVSRLEELVTKKSAVTLV